MTDRLQYGTTAKVLHWLIVALLAVQYPIGWLMPDLHRNMKPGAAMTFHVSFGIVIFLLIVVRFPGGSRTLWRPRARCRHGSG